nr:hypothetical protein [Tanacetum cinerariifolium]
VWNHMKIYVGTPRVAASLNAIIDHIIPRSKKKTTRGMIAKLVFVASTYFIWQERNYRLFKNQKSHLSKIVSARDIHRAGFGMSTMIKDLFNNGQLTWPHDWISKYLVLATIVVPNVVDELEWRDSSGTAMGFFHVVWNHMKIYVGTPRVAASLNVIIDHIIPRSKKKTTRDASSSVELVFHSQKILIFAFAVGDLDAWKFLLHASSSIEFVFHSQKILIFAFAVGDLDAWKFLLRMPSLCLDLIHPAEVVSLKSCFQTFSALPHSKPFPV